MHGQVASEFVRSCESLGAIWPGARVWLLSGVSTHVRLEVVRPGELALADIALEGSDTGVLSTVSTKLVRARKPLPAALVIADIWLLPGVLPDVHLEVGQLQIALGAAGIEADEGLPLLLGL